MPEFFVSVPEVKASFVSERKSEAPSIESTVAASVQFEVTETVPVPPRAVEPEPVVQVPFPKVIVELASIAFVTEEAGRERVPVTVRPAVFIFDVACKSLALSPPSNVEVAVVEA